jgi:hypothetical protein
MPTADGEATAPAMLPAPPVLLKEESGKAKATN